MPERAVPTRPSSISASLLPEWDQEWATTRKLLLLVDDRHAAFRPHAKSMTLGDLALHLASNPTWALRTLETTEFDVAPPGGPAWTPPTFESPRATLALFDANVKAARERIAAADDPDWMVGWSLKRAGATLFTLPRLVCMRSFVINHMIHHRGQMTVYLRMCDVPLPMVYGPTADASF